MANNIKSLEQSMRIIELLKKTHTSFDALDIANKCSVPVATAYRIINTLESGGWLYKDSNNRYGLGILLTCDTDEKSLLYILRDIAYPIMKEYSENTNLPIILTVRDTNVCNILININSTVKTLPLHSNASAKILFSNLPADTVNKLFIGYSFDDFAKNTICDMMEYIKELKRVKKDGFSYDFRESDKNMCQVAVPVFGKNGIVASLSFTDIYAVKKTDLFKYVAILKSASEKISKEIYKY